MREGGSAGHGDERGVAVPKVRSLPALVSTLELNTGRSAAASILPPILCESKLGARLISSAQACRLKVLQSAALVCGVQEAWTVFGRLQQHTPQTGHRAGAGPWTGRCWAALACLASAREWHQAAPALHLDQGWGDR